MFMPPVQSQSTVGQSNESLRIHPLLHCCNCTTTIQETRQQRVSENLSPGYFTGPVISYLLPSGWKATQLIGPKCPLTLPNSSSQAAWKNLRIDTKHRLSQHRVNESISEFQLTEYGEKLFFFAFNQMQPHFPHLASNFPILVEVVVTSMASCPPPITT